ncbi:MAG: RIP metalloprotease RseP [Candidatus Omnitrophota bacterium]|nr:MAG: RIP metalloprotease RseP [Candidatus Omnitrophota bacterium]
MITFLSILIVFSILILIHETGHFLMAKRMGVRIERFSLGFGPKLLSFKKGETEYFVCAIPLGGYVKMAGDEPTETRKGKEWEYLSKPPIKRFGIVISGPLTNYLLAFLLFSLIFVLGAPVITTEVGGVMKDFPAYSAGIKEKDIIISIDGEKVNYWEDLLIEVSKDISGRQMDIVVLRNDEPVSVKLIPKVIEAKNIFGQHIKVGRLGIVSAGKIVTVRTNALKALYLGGKKTIFLTGFTYKALWHIITGGMPVRKSLTGPIGIAAIIGKAAEMGIIYLISITAQINLAIAIFNLLPFPVLDGGHILFLGLERLRRKPLSPKVEQVITQIAITLLIMLAIFVSLNDILKIIK